MKKYLLLCLVLMLVATMVACGGDDKEEEKEAPASTEAPVVEAPTDVPPAPTGPSGELELFSWWAGDEGPALEALITLYGEMYPDVEVVNATVAGGSGTEAKAVLKTRMLGGDPPDSFQVHAGQELIGTWVVGDRMEDLTFLYEEQGWFDKYPQGLIDMMSADGGIWSVPVNIHRSNVFWFIPDNLAEWGVTVPNDWQEFLAMCPTLQDQGVTPLALGRNWTHNHLWEAVAVAELGVDGWNALWSGEKSFTDADVMAVWDVFGQILDCTNADATSLSWQQATDMVISGEAAFNEMGDWAMTYFTVINDLEPGVDYAWAASPGTDGVFMALSDSFGLPLGAPNREAVLAWLRLMGSVEGQDAFNPLKGSIAPHFDSDLSKYNAYLQSAAASWASDTVVGSLAHGAVANEIFMNGFASGMEIFLSTRNSQATGQALQELSAEAGIGEAPVAPPAVEGPSGELELFSWWAGDEGPALEALIALYGEMYPDVEVVNATVAGGSGTEAKAVLKTRMLGGDPPDSFQVHAGQELIGTWVVGDRMEDLTFLYEEQGWFDKYPQGLIDMMSADGGIWSVPVNIHRSNVFWFIPDNLAEWGVTVPNDWQEFLAMCPTLQDQGVTPLALGRNWTHNHLWEAVAVAELGVDGWNALWSGEKSFTDADVMATWDLFGQILDCTNADATSLSWQQATDMVISGEAAFNEMGDWAMTYFTVINDLEPGVDYAWAASPGTDGVFMALSDSFGLPLGAPNREAVLAWLRLMGSVEGQDAFNPLKGSIAPHFDSDLSKYNAYLQSAAASWASDTVVGSLAHGAVANEIFMNGFASGMEIFLSTRNSQATGQALQELSAEAGIGEAPVAPPAVEGPSGELELFSWWAGDEGPALEALIALYGEMYPDVEVVNATVAGGSGTEAKAVLKTRMLGGDPPDSFQVHAGQELIGTWVVGDRMEDLTFLYEEQGWFDKYPQGLIDMMSADGGIWSVPVNIHRSNVFWFIPDNLAEWGVTVPNDWQEFLAMCPTLQDQGVTPLALGRNWTHNHLWEAVAVAELGVDGWNALWSGEKSFTDTDVMAAWDVFGQILDCTNADATSLSWQQATDMVISGEAAFNEMGDWAMTYFTVINDLEPGVDYAWAASPGTDGVFMALSDSFGLPLGAPNREAVLAWLRLMGSVEGQDAFNPLKGSIAPHFDSDLSKYNAYLQSAAASWASDTVVGSLAHGAVANEIFMNGFASGMEIFLSTRNAEATSQALQELCVEAGICR